MTNVCFRRCPQTRILEDVPLSEHEQRLLEQIEQSLLADDPKFVKVVRTDLRTHHRRRLIRAGVLFALGLGTLLAGAVTKIIPVGVAGFVVMLAALLLGLSTWQRLSGRRSPAAAAGPRLPRADRAPRRSLRTVLEERWERRWDDRGRGRF